MCFKELDDLVAEVMDVDDDGPETLTDEILYVVLQERLPFHFD